MGDAAWAIEVIEDLQNALDGHRYKKARKHLNKAALAIADAAISKDDIDLGIGRKVVPIQGIGETNRK